VDLFTKNKSISVRDVARKVGVSNVNVQKTKERFNMKTHKKQKAPKRSHAQHQRAKARSRKLYKHLCANSERCILMDDETYIKMDTRTLPGP
jgi:transposase